MVEHPELVGERIVRLAKLVGRENVIAGTDCGFAQQPTHQRVHPTIQWAKLEALAEGARLASKELWGRGKKKAGEEVRGEKRLLRRARAAKRSARLTRSFRGAREACEPRKRKHCCEGIDTGSRLRG